MYASKAFVASCIFLHYYLGRVTLHINQMKSASYLLFCLGWVTQCRLIKNNKNA